MEISCENLGGKEILVDAIREFAQIYRFDDFRISLRSGVNCVQFDVPSTEWLEHFTEVLRSEAPDEFDRTLRGSGWWFHVVRSETGVALFVDIRQGHRVKIELSLDEAKQLHNILLNAILLPFIAQGGAVDNLQDLKTFELR